MYQFQQRKVEQRICNIGLSLLNTLIDHLSQKFIFALFLQVDADRLLISLARQLFSEFRSPLSIYVKVVVNTQLINHSSPTKGTKFWQQLSSMMTRINYYLFFYPHRQYILVWVYLDLNIFFLQNGQNRRRPRKSVQFSKKSLVITKDDHILFST